MGTRLLSKQSFVMRIHEHLADVARWLPVEHHRLTGVRLPPEELIATLIDARTK